MQTTSDWYRRAATRDLAGLSAVHVSWATGIADDAEVLGLIDTLPTAKRHPSLVFSVAVYLGAPRDADYAPFRAWLLEEWDRVAALATSSTTQTNEAGRCVPLLLALDRLDGPLALLELGAAAGLCLVPDRYSYDLDGTVLGDGSPLLTAEIMGEGAAEKRIPRSLPDIVWRRGVDLTPLDARSPEDRRWLESLVPPDRTDRVERLRAALDTVALDPPTIVEADATDVLEALLDSVPEGTTPVVVALGTLVYLPGPQRQRVLDLTASTGAHLVALEGAGVLTEVRERLAGRAVPEEMPTVLSLDRQPLAFSNPHGDRLQLIG